mmetsp:Transcript_3156/g.6514  ORF Transcript_3156/g.6514 Transcript_3156/m.6514 type:complete len:215 (-) Transcript_3156:137-781(-)
MLRYSAWLAPTVTHTSAIASTSRPRWALYRPASSPTSRGCPAVRVYWWGAATPSDAASARLSVTNVGGSQSGKPCPRLRIVPCRSAASRPNSLHTVGPVERPRRAMASPTRTGGAAGRVPVASSPSPISPTGTGSAAHRAPSRHGAGSSNWGGFTSCGWAQRAHVRRPEAGEKAATEPTESTHRATARRRGGDAAAGTERRNVIVLYSSFGNGM